MYPDDDYPPYVMRAARSVIDDPGSLGIVIGGSGNGEQIAANKIPGIRAAVAWTDETAQLARQHNDANVLSLGARMYSDEAAIGFVRIFVSTPFSTEPRHARRLAEIADYEKTGELPPPAPPGRLSLDVMCRCTSKKQVRCAVDQVARALRRGWIPLLRTAVESPKPSVHLPAPVDPRPPPPCSALLARPATCPLVCAPALARSAPPAAARPSAASSAAASRPRSPPRTARPFPPAVRPFRLLMPRAGPFRLLALAAVSRRPEPVTRPGRVRRHHRSGRHPAGHHRAPNRRAGHRRRVRRAPPARAPPGPGTAGPRTAGPRTAGPGAPASAGTAEPAVRPAAASAASASATCSACGRDTSLARIAALIVTFIAATGSASRVAWSPFSHSLALPPGLDNPAPPGQSEAGAGVRRRAARSGGIATSCCCGAGRRSARWVRPSPSSRCR